MSISYPIRAVAKITGLSLDTLRAWERRYQAVVPDRSERGRQYGPEHIERLLLLNRLVQKGHAIGQIAGLPDTDLQNLLGNPNVAEVEIARPDLLAPLLAALEVFDPGSAGDELSRLAAVLAPRDLVYQVALPLMRETGSRWHNGTLSIAQEHLVSELLRSLLGSMMRIFRHSGAAARVILATPAGEPHEFGILAAAMLASISGLEPVYLGPDLPAVEICRAAERTAAKIVAIGLTAANPNADASLLAIAEALPAEVEFWVGGAGRPDVSAIPRRVVLLKDLPAFEHECLRWKN